MIWNNRRIVPLILAFALLLTACGGKHIAATMHLVRTEGTVQVHDTDGTSVEVAENLGLYSGYGVATQTESYGWINLDDTKLTKMDQESEVEITKQDKLLELYVRSGSLFFNVTEPLAEDETLNIRSSTMTVGIRGTCGWVYVENDQHMRVWLLRGKVECSVQGEDGSALASEMLTAGQTAEMRLEGETASITITDGIDEEDIPDFVLEEIEEDQAMMEVVQIPEPTPTVQPEETPEVTPTESPEVTPEESPEATPTATPTASPDVTPEESPQASPAASPDVTPAESSTPDAPPEAGDTPPENGDGGDTGTGDGGAVAPEESTAPVEDEPTPAETEAPSNQIVLDQYSSILAQAASYTYQTDDSYTGDKKYTYALHQESGYSVPTLIVQKRGYDHNAYLLFRYNANTGTAEQVGSTYATRFEFPSPRFINDIDYTQWYSTSDTSYLASWLS